MQPGPDALYNRTATMALPPARTGIRGRVERSNTQSRRFSPYDGTDEAVDVSIGQINGRQSVFKPSIFTAITQQPGVGGAQRFNEIESLWTGVQQVDFGGDPPEKINALAATLPGAAGISLTPLGGGRVAQPDMTSEVASENGFSSYGGFGPPPAYFQKFDGDPGMMPENWGLTGVRASALQTEMPTPNPGANGDGSDGIFQTTRDGSASFAGPEANPFTSINWRGATTNRVQGVVETHVNAAMIYAVMAALDKVGSFGGNPQWDETQHGEILWQAVEDIGVLAQNSEETENLSPDKLPHSLFNVPSANFWLATLGGGENPVRLPKTARDVLGLLTLHGMIRGDSSARFAPNERFGLSTRVYNCVVGGGEEFVFNEWSATRRGEKVYSIIKRVDHTQIRANPGAPPASYSLSGVKENVLIVPDDKTTKPFQIVPWVKKIRKGKPEDKLFHDRPTHEDLAYKDENGIICKGVAYEVGYVVQLDHPTPLPRLVTHAPFNAFLRKQLPVVGLVFTGRLLHI